MEHDPSIDAQTWEQRGIRARDAGQHAEAEACFTQAVSHSERPLSWLGLALSQIDLNRTDDAVHSLRKAQALSPKSGVVGHLLASLTGEATLRAPDTYVTWLFNTYADSFDNHLTRLGYQGPHMLHQLAERAEWPLQPTAHILDLGCGTGLSGIPFRPYAQQLDGIDLAPRMLEQARNRGIYDTLHHAEAHAALTAMPAASYDTILAADMLIYIGDMAAIFQEVARVLKPGGNFLFTVETGTTSFALASTGRYTHADAYVQRCASEWLQLADHLDGVLRVEAGLATPSRAYRFVKTVN